MNEETDHRGLQTRRTTEAREPKLVYRYEDGYDAEIHPSFESLSEQFTEYAEGQFAAYNVPVWIEYEQETKDPFVSIGLMLTRHGICMLWRSPATPEQFRELQIRMLSVWADRADAQGGFSFERTAPSPMGSDRAVVWRVMRSSIWPALSLWRPDRIDPGPKKTRVPPNP